MHYQRICIDDFYQFQYKFLPLGLRVMNCYDRLIFKTDLFLSDSFQCKKQLAYFQNRLLLNQANFQDFRVAVLEYFVTNYKHYNYCIGRINQGQNFLSLKNTLIYNFPLNDTRDISIKFRSGFCKPYDFFKRRLFTIQQLHLKIYWTLDLSFQVTYILINRKDPHLVVLK